MASPLLVTLLTCVAGVKRGGVGKVKELNPPPLSPSPLPLSTPAAQSITLGKREKKDEGEAYRRITFLDNCFFPDTSILEHC